MHLWNPPFCGDIDMRIAKDGTWFHEGKPIQRQAMVQLFSTILLREADEFFLVTPAEKVRIQVEDCPYVITRMEIEGTGEDQNIIFVTNTEEFVQVDSEHPIEVDNPGEGDEPHPVVLVRNSLWALINRPVFYRLVEAAEEKMLEGQVHIGVWSGGQYFSLGTIE